MSTRAQIWVEGHNASVYKHSDGYPDGVLPVLVPFVRNFMANRGWDPEYMTARILEPFFKEREESYKDGFYKDNPAIVKTSSLLGYGVGGHDDRENPRFHGDENYIYVVKKDWKIEVRETSKGFRDSPILGNTSLVDVVPIELEKK